MTLTAVVNQLGHRVKNTRGLWSWRTGDQVGLVLWSHHLSDDGQSYYNANEGAEGSSGSAKDERRRQHLRYARDHGGKVTSAIVRQDPTTTEESMLANSAIPGGEWWLTNFNGHTGSFELRRVTFGNWRSRARR